MYTYIYITASSTPMTLGHLRNLFIYQRLQSLLSQLWEVANLCELSVTLRSLLNPRWFPPESGNLTRPWVITYKLMEQICVSIWRGLFPNRGIANRFFFLNIWKDYTLIRFIQGFSLRMADLATLAHKMHELPNFGAILLAVLYLHTQISVRLQKQRESFMSLKRL